MIPGAIEMKSCEEIEQEIKRVTGTVKPADDEEVRILIAVRVSALRWVLDP